MANNTFKRFYYQVNVTDFNTGYFEHAKELMKQDQQLPIIGNAQAQPYSWGNRYRSPATDGYHGIMPKTNEALWQWDSVSGLPARFPPHDPEPVRFDSVRHQADLTLLNAQQRK